MRANGRLSVAWRMRHSLETASSGNTCHLFVLLACLDTPNRFPDRQSYTHEGNCKRERENARIDLAFSGTRYLILSKIKLRRLSRL